MDKNNGAQKTILNKHTLMMTAWHCLCISSDIKDIYQTVNDHKYKLFNLYDVLSKKPPIKAPVSIVRQTIVD